MLLNTIFLSWKFKPIPPALVPQFSRLNELRAIFELNNPAVFAFAEVVNDEQHEVQDLEIEVMKDSGQLPGCRGNSGLKKRKK